MTHVTKVAIAGGADGLGKAIREAIAAENKYDCLILSRKASSDPKVAKVDYTNPNALRELLEKEEVHTVISTIGLYTRAHHESQLALIKAAKLSKTTKRFIPSEFGFWVKDDQADMSLSFPFKLETVKVLKETGLEFSLIHTGIFLDYLVWPRIPSPLRVQTLWVHLGKNLAALPGDGSAIVAFTHSRDIGRFVTALLDVPHWKERYCAIADRVPLLEIVRIAEELKGTKFEVRFDSVESMAQGECTLLPPPENMEFHEDRFASKAAYIKYQAALGMYVTRGFADLDPATAIKEVFPYMKPLTIRGAIEEWVRQEI